MIVFSNLLLDRKWTPCNATLRGKGLPLGEMWMQFEDNSIENDFVAKILNSKMKSSTVNFGKVIEKRKTVFESRTLLFNRILCYFGLIHPVNA